MDDKKASAKKLVKKADFKSIMEKHRENWVGPTDGCRRRCCIGLIISFTWYSSAIGWFMDDDKYR